MEIIRHGKVYKDCSVRVCSTGIDFVSDKEAVLGSLNFPDSSWLCAKNLFASLPDQVNMDLLYALKVRNVEVG